MTDEQKTPQEPTFSRESIKEKQKKQKEQYEQQIDEFRKTIRLVADTEAGEKLLQFIFRITGGNNSTLRRNKDGTLNKDETIITATTKGVWDAIRQNMDSDTIKKIERHDWE